MFQVGIESVAARVGTIRLVLGLAFVCLRTGLASTEQWVASVGLHIDECITVARHMAVVMTGRLFAKGHLFRTKMRTVAL